MNFSLSHVGADVTGSDSLRSDEEEWQAAALYRGCKIIKTHLPDCYSAGVHSRRAFINQLFLWHLADEGAKGPEGQNGMKGHESLWKADVAGGTMVLTLLSCSGAATGPHQSKTSSSQMHRAHPVQALKIKNRNYAKTKTFFFHSNYF